ncbi:hypothetical protein IJ556_08140 [bacterium]|nr:hypothetical protein [bacterium]
MLNRYFLKLGKTLFLAFLLFSVTGCGSINAKSAQLNPVASNMTAETDSRLQEKSNNTGNESLSVTVGNNSEKVLKKEYGYRNGDKYLVQYQDNSLVKQIILVEQTETANSIGTLFLLTKNQNGDWQENLQCKAYLGKNGIDKIREGDAKTPTGDFGMLMAFGAKNDPGSLIPYTKLTDTMYLCGDKEYYNQFIDVSKIEHTCSNNSEHLIRYIPQYNYALFFDFNKENVYGKGSAIFLHCAGNNPFTLGCVSVSEENMIQILRTVDINSRICIYAAK